MKHTEIGDVPEDWELQTFEETFRVLSNNTLSRENLNNKGGTVRNIHYGDILTKFSEILNCQKDDIPYINDISSITASTQLLQDGDIVITDTAEDETVGKTTEVQSLGNGKLVAGLHTIPCRVKKGKFAPGWLGYYMNSHIYHDQLIPFITGIKVSSISKSAIAETIILIPPVEEQERIVEILSQIEQLVKKEAVIIEKIKNFKSGCLIKMFPAENENKPEMRFLEYTDDWEQRKLEDTCSNIVAGGDVDKAKLVEIGKYPVIANALYNDGIIGFYNENYRIKAPAVTVTGRGDVGHAKARKVDFTPVVRLLALETTHDVDFIENAINTTNIVNESTGVPQLTVPQLAKCEIFLPPTIEEEKKIGSYFRSLDNLINIHQRKYDKYINIKSGLISIFISMK